MKYPKPKVGDKVLVLDRRRYSHDALTEQTVVKVGRKYFYTRERPEESWCERQIMLKHWHDAWPSRKAYEDDEAARALFTEIRDAHFAPYAPTQLTLDQLRRIKTITEEPQ